MQAIISQILADVEEGQSLSASMGKHPKIFSKSYIALVKSGEVSGVLDDVLVKLSDTMEKQQEFRGKIKGAMVYPIIIILGIFVNLSAAWTLIIAGVLFLSRILSLWIVMIFSPLAFASYAVPGISSMMEEVGHQKWWTNLINLSFLAPIFIFFIYLIILMINSDFLSGLLNTGGDFTYIMVIILLQFLFILFLLKMAKQTAEKLAGEMGSTFVKAAKAVGGVALGAATGGAALMGRASLGRVGSMLAKNEKLKKFAS